MVEIFGLELNKLVAEIQKLGMPAFRAKQIFQWIYEKNVFDFINMRNLSKKDIEKLSTNLTILPKELKVLQEYQSSDHITKKYLLQLSDGATVETVLMHHDYGYSVCVSSQVGCDMHCAFCASGLKGCERSLSKAEILAQVYLWNVRLKAENQHVSRVVVMGSGEPMLNFDNVFGALEFLHDEKVANMSYRNMTVSTCGVVPGIEKMAGLGHPINLAVSLHSVRDEVRTNLMPINKSFPFIKVIAAAEKYAEISGRDVTYEYIMLRDYNDTANDAKLLANYLKFKHASVNLIPANAVAEHGLIRSDDRTIDKFLMILNQNHIKATVRKEMGGDIAAACGQLRNQFKN